MRVDIRRIRADQGPDLMRTRLMALLDAPYAFASTYTDSVQRPRDEWAHRASRAASGGSEAIYLARTEHADMVAMGGAYTPDARADTRTLWGVWVEPALRGQGLGTRLVEALVAWSAGAGARTVELWVAEPNDPARAVYAALGFEDTGERRHMASDEAVVERRLVRPAGRGPSV